MAFTLIAAAAAVALFFGMLGLQIDDPNFMDPRLSVGIGVGPGFAGL